MNEFEQLSWRIKTPSALEQHTCFLTDECISDSLVYKSFVKPISSTQNKKNKKKLKLHLNQEEYFPGKNCFKPIHKRSLLSKRQKSTCLKALKLIQSGKSQETFTASEKYALKIYNECHQNIVEENQQYLAIAKRVWEKNSHMPVRIQHAVLNYGKFHWKRRLNLVFEYPRFYKETLMIGLNFQETDDVSINFEHISNLLEIGSLARYSAPNLKEISKLKIITLPIYDKNLVLNSKLPVSQDENIKNLLDSNKIDFVTSSSVLKQIIDYTDTKTKWIIPVIVRKYKKADESVAKTVFLDKVLPKTHPTYHDLNYFTFKQLVKTNFCQFEAFKFPNEETPTNRSIACEADIFGDAEAPTKKKKKERQRMIHHNVSYRIWNVQKSGDQSNLIKNKTKNSAVNLLVRCKLDGCECTEQGVLQPVVVTPKLEQQLQFGANIPSKTELAREWAALFFRLYSNLYRARISMQGSEVISVEKCSLQKINAEASCHYDYKPVLGLGVLQNVMEHLYELPEGNYLLVHLPKHGSFAQVLKECEETNIENGFDLHADYENSDVDSQTKTPWLPIDSNYILPVHEHLQHMPAMFRGFDKLKTGDLGTTKKGKKLGG